MPRVKDEGESAAARAQRYAAVQDRARASSGSGVEPSTYARMGWVSSTLVPLVASGGASRLRAPHLSAMCYENSR